MIHFELKENGEIIIQPESLLITEIKAIWEADKSSGKGEARKDLHYVFLMSEPDPKRNNLTDLPYYELEPRARKEAFGAKDFEIPQGRKARLDSAIKVYRELNESDDYRLFQTVKKNIEDIRLWLDEFSLEEERATIEREEDRKEQEAVKEDRKYVRLTRRQVQKLISELAGEKLDMMAKLEKASKQLEAIRSRLTFTTSNQKLRANAQESLLEMSLI